MVLEDIQQEEEGGVRVRLFLERRARSAVAMCVCIAAALFYSFGCGHYQQPIPPPDPNLGELNSLEDLIYSDNYAGQIVIHFDETLKVRLSTNNKFYSAIGSDDDLRSINGILDRYHGAEVIRSTQWPAEKIEENRVKLERLSGTSLVDFNSVYNLRVEDRADAVNLYRILIQQPGVLKVYPALKPRPISVEGEGAGEGNSLTVHQGYLYSEEASGGLNAEAMWDAQIFGDDVFIIDNEDGVNFGHADLGLMEVDIRDNQDGSYFYPPDCRTSRPDVRIDCRAWIAHGTAMAGVMVAEEGNFGVTGFAPDARYVLSPASMSAGLWAATDGLDDTSTGADDDIEPGSIWLIPYALAGKYSNQSDSSESLFVEGQYGTIPVEAYPGFFGAIQQATAYGVTVIVGAGNGQMNLDEEDLYSGEWDFLHNLSRDDAGSIMVGASEGPNESRIFFSNCGSRLDTFAWGLGVVTTGYQYGLYGWTGTESPVPSNDDQDSFFIDNFGGTSSAMAMIGGAAALVQSHARRELGFKRYLMPLKIREILAGSGVPQADGGCNIGRQPRLDVAKEMVDSFLSQMRSAYPELESGGMLAQDRMIEMRRAGIGIICKVHDPAGSDPICPDEELFPAGTGVGRPMDFDGDGRADLVQWTNPSTSSGRSGTLKLDLSSYAAGVFVSGSQQDNFGEWDVTAEYPPIEGQWVWPYMDDINADGRTDLVVYDKGHGTWYIAFTSAELIRDGSFGGWDWVIDYSAEWHDSLALDPDDSDYSRPAVGDYDGDGWIDIAIACSDGFWRIDYGGPDREDFGAFDRQVRYLSDEELALAPGWAYPVAPYYFGNSSHRMFIIYKIPDGLPEEGRLHVYSPTSYTNDWLEEVQHIYGGNEVVILPGQYLSAFSEADVGLLYPNGRWSIAQAYRYNSIKNVEPVGVYGNGVCHPIVADFDGDGMTDRTVMCPREWRIVYSSDAFAGQAGGDGVRRVPLGYDTNVFTLPGRSYSGGISYKHARQLIGLFQDANPGTPPPITVDMVGFGTR